MYGGEGEKEGRILREEFGVRKRANLSFLWLRIGRGNRNTGSDLVNLGLPKSGILQSWIYANYGSSLYQYQCVRDMI